MLFRSIVWEHSLVDERAQSPKLFVLRTAASILYGRAQTVVCVSQPLAEDIKRISPRSNVVAISNQYVEPPKPLIDTPDGSHSGTANIRLVSVGSLNKNKNQSLIISALAHLPHAYSLVVVGDGPERSSLESLAVKLAVDNRVSFRGMQSHDVVLREIFDSDILVHAAHGETFGLVFLEAASMCTPVVATDNRMSRVMIPRFAPGAVCVSDDRKLAASIEKLAARGGSDFEAARVERVSHFGSSGVKQAWSELIVGEGNEV